MSKEKQIEEMANDLSKVQNFGLVVTESQMDSRMSYSREIKNKEVSEALYNAGYRKQSEGVWTPYFEDVEIYNSGGFTERIQTGWICGNCKTKKSFSPMHKNYCSFCGAKMKKGGN